MWPYVRLNPIGIIILCLLFFSLYLIYSANSASNDFMRNYGEQQNLISNYRKKLHPDDDDEMMPSIGHRRNSLINDEIIKQEFKLFSMVNLIELLNVAIQAAENGGRQVRKVRELSKLKQKNKAENERDANDPLTEGKLLNLVLFAGNYVNILMISVF